MRTAVVFFFKLFFISILFSLTPTTGRACVRINQRAGRPVVPTRTSSVDMRRVFTTPAKVSRPKAAQQKIRDLLELYLSSIIIIRDTSPGARGTSGQPRKIIHNRFKLLFYDPVIWTVTGVETRILLYLWSGVSDLRARITSIWTVQKSLVLERNCWIKAMVKPLKTKNVYYANCQI